MESNLPSERANLQASLRDKAVSIMEQAMDLSVGLTEDDSVYGLVYIGEKLTKCSAYMEQLGDMSINLARMSLDVTRQLSVTKSLMLTKERQFRADPMYVNGERNEKTGWLQGKLEVWRIELEDWELTHAYLVEIRGAVNDRIQLIKRLDSDIRLQHKLIEAKIASGAGGNLPGTGNQGSNGFPGSKQGVDELDIDD